MQITPDAPKLDSSALFELLNNRFSQGEKKLSEIPDPTLLHDGVKSAKKIAQTIRDGKKITVVGDYDVDGVSSTAIMLDFFKQVPYEVEAIIPNRFQDGYGVSPSVLQKINTDLIITVDNGISAIDAAQICKQRGIDLIITDHHTPSQQLPDAYAIVDPKLPECKYPFKEICGAQVAWLLLALVKKELSLQIDMKQFLDILAIAIIADIMPLIDINRTLVKEGLKVLMSSHRPASIIIRDFLNRSSISSEDIAFQIAPRINSAGRLEDASIALEFFTAATTEKAYQQFEKLNKLNELRKFTEAECTQEAIASVAELNDIIVVAKEGWHEGVVGIVAARLVEHFQRPAIVLSIDGENAKGSARSIGDVNIYSLIKQNEHYLLKFGGHKMAAGLTLKTNNIKKFTTAINQSAKQLSAKDFLPKDEVAGILDAQMINFELLELLESFEPYGEANPRPRFLIKNAEILQIKSFGNDKSHSKVTLKLNPNDHKTLELIYFRKVLEMPKNRAISCSYTINKNEFNGRFSMQLLINKTYN